MMQPVSTSAPLTRAPVLAFLETRSRQVLLVSWACYLAAATGIVVLLDTPLSSDPSYFLDIARSVARGNGFMEGYLYAYRPPAYPAWLAVALGLGLKHVVGLKLFMVATMSASVPLTWLLCRAQFGLAAAALGAVFVACSPWFVTLPDLMFSEGLFIPLFVLFLLLLSAAFQSPTMVRFAVAGAMCGILALVREVVMYAPLLLLVALAVCDLGTSFLRTAAFFAAFATAEALAISPWTLRNYSVFDQLIAISTNPWMNIYIGNNARFDSVHEYHWTIPEGLSWNQRPQAGGSDELAVVAACKSEAINYIRSEPLAFVRRSLAKMWMFVTPHFGLVARQSSRVVALSVFVDLMLYCGFLLAASWHLFRVRRVFKPQPQLVFYLTYCVYSVVIAGLTFSNSRYRLPFVLIVLVLSTAGFVDILGRVRSPAARRLQRAPNAQ